MGTFRSKKSLCNYLKIKYHFLPFLSKLLGKTRSLLRKFCSLLVFRSKLRRKGRKSTSRDRRTEAHKTNCEPLFFLRSCKERSGGVIIYKTSYIRSATYIFSILIVACFACWGRPLWVGKPGLLPASCWHKP